MLSKSIWNSFPRTIRNEKIWITNTQEGRGGGEILKYIAWTQRCLITFTRKEVVFDHGRTPPLLVLMGRFTTALARKKLTNTPLQLQGNLFHVILLRSDTWWDRYRGDFRFPGAVSARFPFPWIGNDPDLARNFISRQFQVPLHIVGHMAEEGIRYILISWFSWFPFSRSRYTCSSSNVFDR